LYNIDEWSNRNKGCLRGGEFEAFGDFFNRCGFTFVFSSSQSM
jgi:hypothetical protein